MCLCALWMVCFMHVWQRWYGLHVVVWLIVCLYRCVSVCIIRRFDDICITLQVLWLPISRLSAAFVCISALYECLFDGVHPSRYIASGKTTKLLCVFEPHCFWSLSLSIGCDRIVLFSTELCLLFCILWGPHNVLQEWRRFHLCYAVFSGIFNELWLKSLWNWEKRQTWQSPYSPHIMATSER